MVLFRAIHRYIHASKRFYKLFDSFVETNSKNKCLKHVYVKYEYSVTWIKNLFQLSGVHIGSLILCFFIHLSIYLIIYIFIYLFIYLLLYLCIFFH